MKAGAIQLDMVGEQIASDHSMDSAIRDALGVDQPHTNEFYGVRESHE